MTHAAHVARERLLHAGHVEQVRIGRQHLRCLPTVRLDRVNLCTAERSIIIITFRDTVFVIQRLKRRLLLMLLFRRQRRRKRVWRGRLLELGCLMGRGRRTVLIHLSCNLRLVRDVAIRTFDVLVMTWLAL